MTQELRSVIVWLGAFLALELTPTFWPGCPWNQLTGTIRGGIKWWHPVALMVTVFLFVLWGHFDRGWNVGWLISVAVLIAAALVAHAFL